MESRALGRFHHLEGGGEGWYTMIGAGEFSWMLRSSSVVERSAVNRLVAGSNPACGANALGRCEGSS